jgi:hypothetical protein
VRPQHARVVNAMSRDVVRYLMQYFKTPLMRGWPPSSRLAEVEVGQADVVLALLRADFIDQAEALMGHRIIRCPPCLRPRAPLVMQDNVAPDRRRVLRVLHNTRAPNTPAHYRFGIFRPGMTIEQFLVRGGTRLDVRIALRRGLVELEAA